MVKSETHQDAEILVKIPSPRPLGKKLQDLKKGKNKPCKNEILRLLRYASRFLSPTFFEVPFATPYVTKFVY